MKINRKLNFSGSEQPSSSGPTHRESSPGLPPVMPPAVTGLKTSSARIVRVNGGSSSLSAVEKEKAQAQAQARGGKANTKSQLEQVVEEDPPTPVVEPTPPANKKKKHGLLVSKKAAVGEKKKAFSMEDMGFSDESMDETEALEVEEEEEVHPTVKRNALDGLQQTVDDSVVMVENDTVMAETEEEDEDSDSLPDIIPLKLELQARLAKSKLEPKAAKKTKTAHLDKGGERGSPQPTKTKVSSAGKPIKWKATKVAEEQEPEPTPVAKIKPTPRVRGKKAPPVASPEETEGETEEEEPMRLFTSTPLRPKTAAKGKGKGKAVVGELEPELTPHPPRAKAAVKGKGKGRAVVEEPELTPPPQLKAKPTVKGKGRGKAAGKAVQEPEEIPESEQESEKPEGSEEEGEEQEEQPPKKRSRTTKEKAPPRQKLSAKAKGKAPAAPPKEKPTKTAKKTAQRIAALSPELESFTPSSPPIPIRTKAKVSKVTKAEASSSMPPPASQLAEKKSGQRTIKAPPPPPRAPTEDIDGIRRSTRPRVEPLAYWKNEKIVYGLGARSKGNIRLPEVVEIVRVESDSEEERGRVQRRKKAYAISRAGAKRKRSTKELSEDEFEEEDWESRTVDGEVGVVKGYVKSYPPGGAAGEEELEEVELAFSRNRIVTVEVANGDFTFVKTCTEEFFGTGMIEVPPGGIKRTKNSGKMHLVFYIISGKVEVKIGENSFRVRKGAQFMVPRGMVFPIPAVFIRGSGTN